MSNGVTEEKWSGGRKATIISGGIVGLAVFIAFLPSLHSGFVNWDDQQYVYENPVIRNLDLNFLKTVFTTVLVYNWHPLTMLSYGIDYALWGLDPWGYHLENIILHALNTALVFLLVLRLSREAGKTNAILAGCVAGFIFGVHPLHVESVSWVSERKDVLSAFFFLLAILSYLKYSSLRKSFSYAASLVFFTLALLSKPMAVTLPAALLIMEYGLGRLDPRSWESVKSRVIEKAPFFILSVLSSAITVWAQNRQGALTPIEAYPLIDRLTVVVRAYVFYLYKFIAPVGLAPFYPLPGKSEFFGAGFFVSLAVFAAVTVFCVFSARRSRVIPAAWLYYVVTLLPVIGIIQVGNQFAADRYAYLPQLSLAVLAGLGAGRLFESPAKSTKTALVAALLLIAALLIVLTVRQEAVWADSITLWTREIEAFPGKVPLAYNQRGYAYEKKGDFSAALKDFNSAIAANPAYTASYINRGIAHAELGMFDKSIEDFKKAITLDPGKASAYYNLSRVYSKTGDTMEADFYRQKGDEAGEKK